MARARRDARTGRIDAGAGGLVLPGIALIGSVAGRRVRQRPPRRAALALGSTALLVLGLVGCSPPSPDRAVAAPPRAQEPASATPSATPSAGPSAGSAAALLASLPIKGRAPMTGYSRDEFGQAWADVDRNGCDTRNDVLRRDLHDTVIKAGTNGCVVLSGTSPSDPYTAKVISFTRGGASELDIDHVVALGDAWQTGAQPWDGRQRIAFGNDPLNLLAVDAAANRQKGASDAASWLPANKAYRCSYVARQVAVKAKYGLWVTAAEADAIERILDRCPGQAAPVGDAPILAPAGLGVVPPENAGPASTAPATSGPAPTTPAPSAETAVDPRFPYCKDLPAGYGPYYEGTDPEYAWYRDADGDGVVCE